MYISKYKYNKQNTLNNKKIKGYQMKPRKLKISEIKLGKLIELKLKNEESIYWGYLFCDIFKNKYLLVDPELIKPHLLFKKSNVEWIKLTINNQNLELKNYQVNWNE